jgi:hypothetical protein
MQSGEESRNNTVLLRREQVVSAVAIAALTPATVGLTLSVAQVLDRFEYYMASKLGRRIHFSNGARLQLSAAEIKIDFDRHRERSPVDVVSARLPAHASTRLILDMLRHSGRQQLEQALHSLRDPDGRHRRTNAAKALACFVHQLSLRAVAIDPAFSTTI